MIVMKPNIKMTGESLAHPRKEKTSRSAERFLRVRQVAFWIAKGYSTEIIKRMIRTMYDLKSDVAVNKLFREAAQELEQ